MKQNLEPDVSKILYARTAQIHQLLTVNMLNACALDGHHLSSDAF